MKKDREFSLFNHLNKCEIPNPYGGGVIDLSELNFKELSNILIELRKHKSNEIVDYIWNKVYEILKNYNEGINMIS